MKYKICYFVLMFQIQDAFGNGPNFKALKSSNRSIDTYAAHCFQFTWLGPMFDNNTYDDKNSCKIWKKKTHMKDIPCTGPLVVTYDGSPPNLTYLMNNYRQKVLCPRVSGESCIKYTYYFNSQVQNITYMCGKALAVDEGPVTRGCFSQFDSGYETEVCVCQSGLTDNIPCNASSGIQVPHLFLTLTVIFYLLSPSKCP